MISATSGIKRVSSIFLSSLILLTAPGPLALSAFAEDVVGRSAAIRTAPVVIPNMTAPINTEIGIPQAALGIEALSPGAVPQIPVVQNGQALMPAQARAAEASVSVPAIAGSAASVTAGAVERSVQPSLSGAAPSASEAKGSQDQIYDSSSRSDAPLGAGAVAGNYMESAPALPLPRLKPQWKESAAPTAASLKYRFESKGMTEIGRVSALSVSEDLKPEPAAGLFKDITPEDESLSYGKRLYMDVKTGVKQGRMIGEDVAWTDSEGRLNVYSPRKDATVVYKTQMGPIEKFVTSPHSKTVYVLAGGSLQRWDLDSNKADVIMDEKVTSLGLHDLSALRSDEDGVEVKTDKGQLMLTRGGLTLFEGTPGQVVADQGVPPTLRAAGAAGDLYIENTGAGSRIWKNSLGGNGSAVEDLGALPFDVKAVVATKGRDTIFAVTDQGLVEWDMAGRRYRLFEIEGLRSAAVGRNVTLDLSLNGRQALVASGDRLFYVDLGDATRDAESKESKIREWSDENPMFVKDGLLHIGEFSFPVQQRKVEPVKLAWYQRIWNRIRGIKEESSAVRGPSLSAEDWKAVNLPTNKWAIYQTLKGFTLGQHVLYIGETGGGKTWMSEKLSKLIGRKLYMVSFTEYTKNQDLLFSRTFGEEKKGATGKSFETVLQWLSDPEGGILLLDEMHKPLEGIAALNNVLQNLKYHLAGQDIAGSKNTHFVIGTMNPVKPPYKGEPPSGELSSRFGVTLEVNYLPKTEESALIKIFYPGLKQEVAKRLVAIANDLRKAYPDLLPLPVAPRTLLQIAAKLVAFPQDDPVDAFKTTYNPSSIVQDQSIIEAIEKALTAHDLAGAVNPGQKKK